MQSNHNKDLFETLFDSAPNGIAILKTIYDGNGQPEDFTILRLNEYYREWIGDIDYDGKRYGDLFPTVKQNGILLKFIKVAQTGNPTNFELWYHGEGMQYWFRFTAVKMGELLVVTTEDITERKDTEFALSDVSEVIGKQKRIYDSIIDNTPDLAYVFALDYTFEYANKALLQMWGKSAGEAIGKGLRENGYEEWHALMHEREIDEVVATKKSVRGTVSFPHAELGSRVYDYILVPVINEDGIVEAVAGTTRDITEIKNAQEKLQQSEASIRNMINQTPAATLVLMGDELRIEQVNKSMLELIGRGEEVIGKPLIEVLPELEGQYIWEQVQKVYWEGIPFNQSEVPVPHNRTGEMREYYYNLSYQPLHENGRITGMIQVAIDVTEQVVARKKLEKSEKSYKTLSQTLDQQVKERTKELQRSNDDLQQFAHVASHDLREPIRKIKIFTGRLQDHLSKDIDATTAQYLEKIHGASNRMFTMVEGVLNYSTMNAIRQTPEKIDLNEVIRNIETDLEVALQKNSGKIIHDDLPEIEGAQVLIYQLFYNLINNSLKFARTDTPPVITINSELFTDGEKQCVKLTLRDNGIGFEADQAYRIFETFTRLNSKDKYEGTGLGLSLCKKIVERHHGKITASSEEGEGATFVIMLPIEQSAAGI